MWKKPNIEESDNIRPVTEQEMNEIAAEWSFGACILAGVVCTSEDAKGLKAQVGICLFLGGTL